MYGRHPDRITGPQNRCQVMRFMDIVHHNRQIRLPPIKHFFDPLKPLFFIRLVSH
jgi:hypothetical protein